MVLELMLASGGHGEWYLDPHGFGLVFWTGISFMIVLLVLYKTAWGPLLQALDAREAAIDGQKREAERLRQDAERLRQEYETKLEGHRKEGQRIIDEGERDKKRILDEAHARAATEAKEIRDRADRDVSLAKNKALAELKNEAVKLGLAVAEKVIGAEVDAARHRAIIDEVVVAYEKK